MDCVEYLKDDDGFTVIEIEDESSIISDELMECIESESLSLENIFTFEFTELVRGAYENEYLRKTLKKYLGYNPLPLRSDLEDFKLHPHQIKAIHFMCEKENKEPNHGVRGGIIKMEMGMGKTLTAISYSLIAPRPPRPERFGENGFPTLIISSKTVMSEWKTEGFEKFFGNNVKVLYLHKDYIGSNIKSITRKYIVGFDFVITTYDACGTICKLKNIHEDVLEYGDENSLMKGKVIAVHERLRSQTDKPSVSGLDVIYYTPWERVICDESQTFANPTTKRYRYMMAIYGKYKWCLTGTPIRNYETDIWSQFRFCGYGTIQRAIEWKRNSYDYMKKHNLGENILDMSYNNAGITLSEKKELNITVTLDGMEKKCYEFILGMAVNLYDEMMSGLCSFACILAVFTRLRQCCIAPYIITKKVRGENSDATEILNKLKGGELGAWTLDINGTAGIRSKKILKIVELISSLPENEKVLVFSSFSESLYLLGEACKEYIKDFNYEYVTGDIKGKDRKEVIESFKNNESVRGLFLTYKVGSEGLNLTNATNVICIEPWWNNSTHSQAKSRCWRFGQTEEVKVYNLYIQDSIEDRIMEICGNKDDMAQKMLEGVSGGIKNVRMDKKTLGRILGIF